MKLEEIIAKGVGVGWIPRNVYSELVWGPHGSGKSGVTIAKVFDFIRKNHWVKFILTPIPIWDGPGPEVGPAVEPRKLFDNSDGRWPALAKCKALFVEDNWAEVFHDLQLGKYQEGILILDEVSRVAAAMSYGEPLGQMITGIINNQGRYNIKVFLTEQRKDNLVIGLRQSSTEIAHPFKKPDGSFPTQRSPSEVVRYAIEKPSGTTAYRYGGVNEEPRLPVANSGMLEEDDDPSAGAGVLTEEDANNTYVTFPFDWKTIQTYYSRNIEPDYSSEKQLTDASVKLIIDDGLAHSVETDPFLAQNYFDGGKLPDITMMQKPVEVWLSENKWALTKVQTDKVLLKLRSYFVLADPNHPEDSFRVGVCSKGHERILRMGNADNAQCGVTEDGGKRCRLRLVKFYRYVRTGAAQELGAPGGVAQEVLEE